LLLPGSEKMFFLLPTFFSAFVVSATSPSYFFIISLASSDAPAPQGM
jgi:hypothetical protein